MSQMLLLLVKNRKKHGISIHFITCIPNIWSSKNTVYESTVTV